jgi:hypothetical protein
MIRGLIGPERFQTSLQAYLRKYAYTNAKSEDLWQSIQAVSLMSLKSYMLVPEHSTECQHPIHAICSRMDSESRLPTYLRFIE